MSDYVLKRIGDLNALSTLLATQELAVYDPATQATYNMTLAQLVAYTLANAALQGTATTGTPNPGANNNQVANTAWVQGELGSRSLNPATASQSGTVRTNTTNAAPVVYLKSEVDAIAASITTNGNLTTPTLNNPTISGGGNLGSGSYSGNATIGGNLVLTGNNQVNGNLTIGSASGNAKLTSKPDQIAATDTEIVNADWVRQSIRPVISVTGTSGQSFTSGTASTVIFNTEVEDLDNCFSLSTFTVPTGAGGWYAVYGVVGFASSMSVMILNAFVNGTTAHLLFRADVSSNSLSTAAGTALVKLNAGDTVTLRLTVFTTDSTARTINNSLMRIIKQGES